MFKVRDFIYSILFVFIVLVLWVGLVFLPGPALVDLPAGVQGSHDLTKVDFSNTIYRLPQSWETWPEELYTSEELENAEDPIAYDSGYPYATHRVELELTPNQTYGIAHVSTDFAMRVFVDGEELVAVGNPAATKEENIPQVREVVYYFTPQDKTVEIIVQSSNYVHYLDGTKAPKLVIGTADNIALYASNISLRSGIAFGALVATALYYFSIFLLNRRQRTSLLFSLLCLCIAFMTVKHLALFSNEQTWLLFFRFEYIANLAAGVLLVLLVRTLFPHAVHRRVLGTYLICCALYAVIVLFSEPLFFTGLLTLFQIVSIGVVVYIIMRLAFQLNQKKLKDLLAFLGLVFCGLFVIYELLGRIGIVPVLFVNNQQIVTISAGVVVLVACYALVVSIEQTEVNQKLIKAREALVEAEARYESLLQEYQKDSEPPVLIESFSLTRREEEVALLLFDGKSREDITEILNISRGTVNFHCNNIYRKMGVSSVAELMKLMMPNNNGNGDTSTKKSE